MVRIFVFAVLFLIYLVSCQQKQPQNIVTKVVKIDTAKLRIDSIATVQADEAREKARIIFSESQAIDTLRKYAFKEFPFNHDFSVSVNSFNNKQLLGIITFTDGEPYPPYFAFYFDKNLSRKSFKKANVPVSSSPYGQGYELKDVNNDGYKDFSYNWDKYEGRTYLYNPKSKKFEYNPFYDGTEVYFNKKLGLVCKEIWGTGGSHWAEISHFKISGDSLILYEIFEQTMHGYSNTLLADGSCTKDYSYTHHRIINGKKVLKDSFFGIYERKPKKFRHVFHE